MTKTPFASRTVLVTGATGRIGRVVVADLLSRGFAVRAITSKQPPSGNSADGRLEWKHFNLLGDQAYDEIVQGCDAVIHLAAELGRMEKMMRTNMEATSLLAEAAERHHVRSFCYASSVAVYGSGRQRRMIEESPVLTAVRDLRSEYWALPYVRMYGRTKLLGEYAIRQVAQSVHYTILRPAVVVDVAQLIAIRDWGLIKRSLAAHRHAHHIYVHDVSDAMIWSIMRGMDGPDRAGSVEVFNLSEDEFEAPKHADFMRKAAAATGDKRFQARAMPGFGDWLHDLLRFRANPLRNPLWRMRFPNEKLLAAGYRPPYGMATAYAEALERLGAETAQHTRGTVEPVAFQVEQTSGAK